MEWCAASPRPSMALSASAGRSSCRAPLRTTMGLSRASWTLRAAPSGLPFTSVSMALTSSSPATKKPMSMAARTAPAESRRRRGRRRSGTCPSASGPNGPPGPSPAAGAPRCAPSPGSSQSSHSSSAPRDGVARRGPTEPSSPAAAYLSRRRGSGAPSCHDGRDSSGTRDLRGSSGTRRGGRSAGRLGGRRPSHTRRSSSAPSSNGSLPEPSSCRSSSVMLSRLVPVAASELEVEELGRALRAERVDEEQGEREDSALPRPADARQAVFETLDQAARDVLDADAEHDEADDGPGDRRADAAQAGDEPPEHPEGPADRVGAEEHPGHADEGEHGETLESPRPGRRNRHGQTQSLARVGAGALEGQADAVHASPEHERPAGAVPEPGEEERDDEVHVRAAAALAVAAQRDVEVVPQPAGQRDVPATPEVLDGTRGVRRVEVLGQLDAEKQRDADGDVAVGAEVAVDLHRVGDDPPQGLPGRERLRRGEDAVDDVRRQVVGDQYLLGQAAEDEDEGAAGVDAVRVARRAQLRQEVAGTGDRTREQVREERHVDAEVQRRGRGQLPAVDVDGVGEHAEDEERDAHRQKDAQERQRSAEADAAEPVSYTHLTLPTNREV